MVSGYKQTSRQAVFDQTAAARAKYSKERKSNRRSLPAQIAPITERKKPTAANPYPRVPIVKVEDRYVNYGTFVYRGLNPRTSDRYFNTLREVDYSQPPGFDHWKDRLKEPLSFNSKFESGNLNYAIKVQHDHIKGLDAG